MDDTYKELFENYGALLKMKSFMAANASLAVSWSVHSFYVVESDEKPTAAGDSKKSKFDILFQLYSFLRSWSPNL